MAQGRDQLAEHVAAPAALRRTQHGQEQLVRAHAGPALGCDPDLSAPGDLHHGADQVDPGGCGIGRLHQPGIDIDDEGPVGTHDDVDGQPTVPAEGCAQRLEVVPGRRQAHALLVAGPAVGALGEALTRVERDQFPVVEDALDHDQRAAHRLLHQDRTPVEDAAGSQHRCDGGGLAAGPDQLDTGRGGADRQFHEGREVPVGCELTGVGDHGCTGLGQIEPGERPVGRDLVLHRGQGVELRDDGGDSGVDQPVVTEREDRHLLLRREQDVEVAGRPDGQGGLQPRERSGP
jgi:hypothetical protein